MEPKQKAYIQKLVIKNFKKYSSCEVEFTDGLNVLVGPNNAGKTTILEAIDILIGERNLSPLAVKRNLFNSFRSGESNNAKLIAELIYPESNGSGEREINFIKQLKLGRGSVKSRLAKIEFPGQITIQNILDESIPESGDFFNDTAKTGFKIDNIFLVTEISVSESNTPEVTNDIYINITEDDQTKKYLKLISVSGSQKATILNYLLLPANRINNKNLTEVTDFNWLGRYIKGYISKNDLTSKLEDFNNQSKYPVEILDTTVDVVLAKLFSSKEKLALNLFNPDDLETIVTNARFYIRDGINDEITNKAQGIQSAAIIALFAGYCKFQSDSVPKNPQVSNMWNTIFSFEEPESHFHPPLRNKLLRLLKEEFLDGGAQIFLSTHDSGFINWQYINKGNVIFPNSITENKVNCLNLSEIQDSNQKRIIRFSGRCFFTDMVLIVEGLEEVCIDLAFQLVTSKSLEDLGIVTTRTVGGVRTTPPNENTCDINALGGKDDIPENVNFFNGLKIDSICLIDCDVLFGNGETIKKIYKEKTGNGLILSKNYNLGIQEGKKYLAAKKWWETNKCDSDLIVDITKLNDEGIFLFPGDFEAIFKEDYLEKYETDPTKINKEKFTYETKYLIETNPEEFANCLSEEGKSFLSDAVSKIEAFVAKVRQEKNHTISEEQDQSSAGEIVDTNNELPF